MIGESNYIEIMKNCSNWNSRIETERKGRYPVLDAQTGIAQRPSQNSPVTFVNRYSSALPSQVCVYMSRRWKKRIAAPSSDATEMKYIVQCNPAINDVLNQTTTNNSQSDFSMVSGESSLTPSEIVQIEKRSIKIPYEATFDDEIEDRSEEEPLEISDEDEWSEGKRKRKKRNTANISTASRSTSRKSNANSSSAGNNSGSSNAQNSTSLNVPTQPNDPKPFVCQQCGAKYKSRPGLNYHRAHVHPETASRSSTPHCIT